MDSARLAELGSVVRAVHDDLKGSVESPIYSRSCELGKPYDLLVLGLGRERHVEVKGSVLAVGAVELTVNEVTHAHNHHPTDLVVVDQIAITEGEDGKPQAAGGSMRIWRDWRPEANRLALTRYRYDLPPGGEL
ncbi:protein NO VEIN domain-containing protein [Actinokineospora sp. NPDC004072]